MQREPRRFTIFSKRFKSNHNNDSFGTNATHMRKVQASKTTFHMYFVCTLHLIRVRRRCTWVQHSRGESTELPFYKQCLLERFIRSTKRYISKSFVTNTVCGLRPHCVKFGQVFVSSRIFARLAAAWHPRSNFSVHRIPTENSSEAVYGSPYRWALINSWLLMILIILWIYTNIDGREEKLIVQRPFVRNKIPLVHSSEFRVLANFLRQLSSVDPIHIFSLFILQTSRKCLTKGTGRQKDWAEEKKIVEKKE